MSFIRRTQEIRLGNLAVTAIGLCLLLTSCYIHRAPCPAYVDENYVRFGAYEFSDPVECSTWYESPDEYYWISDSKSAALQLWAEISARPMDFEIDGEFKYTVTSKDGYKYYFWNMYTYPVNNQDPFAQAGWQYIISVDKLEPLNKRIDI